MKVFIAAVMILLAFAMSSEAQKPQRPIGSGNFHKTTRYYGSNGRTIATERRYPDRSYFYSPNGLKSGEKVNNGNRTKR